MKEVQRRIVVRRRPARRAPAPAQARTSAPTQVTTSDTSGLNNLLYIGFLALFIGVIVWQSKNRDGGFDLLDPSTWVGESKTVASAPAPAEPAPTAAEPAAIPAPMAAPMEPAPMAQPPSAIAALTEEKKKAEVSMFSTPLVLDGVQGRSRANLQRDSDLLRTALESGNWEEYMDLLRRSMQLELRKAFDFSLPQSYDRFFNNPVFYSALLRHQFLAKIGDSGRRFMTEDSAHAVFHRWLLETPAAMESFLNNVKPGDNTRSALRIWAELGGEDAEARDKYRELALACALVFDQPFTPNWNGERLNITAQERFEWFKSNNEKREFPTLIHRMKAEQLMWCVSVPVPKSEMEWALRSLRREVRLKQNNWGGAYGMVPYDMEKAVTGKQKKPYEIYTFAEILEKGGICGDRAYFAANMARSVGIPAVPISGDGPKGPHAWIAWLSADDRWEFSGRFGGYPAARITDPQTGDQFSEQTFLRLADRKRPSQRLSLKAQRFLWLADIHEQLGDLPKASTAIELAVKTATREPEVWQAKLGFWRTRHRDADVKLWRSFIDSWKREWRDDTDMLAMANSAEEQFIFPRQDEKTTRADLRSDMRGLERSRPGSGGLASTDEILRNFRLQAELLAPKKDYNGIRALYHRAFREHGNEAAKWKALARDYWRFVKEDAEARKAAAREIEQAYERNIESRNGDFFDVQSQNSCAAMLAGYWREAGDETKAARFEREIERRSKRSTRDAL